MREHIEQRGGLSELSPHTPHGKTAEQWILHTEVTAGQGSSQQTHLLLLPSGLLELPEQDLLGPLAHGGDPGHQPDREGDPGEGHVPHRDP